MKKIFVFMLILMMVIPSSANGENAFSFTDDTGERITLEEKPVRTAVLFSSLSEMWLNSGGSVEISVYETVERGFTEGNIILVDSGAGKKIDLEALVLSEADFIIGSKDIPAHCEAREKMRAMDVKFALFRVESIEDYLRVFRIMTGINKNEDAYRMLGENVYEKAQNVILKSLEYKEKYGKSILFIRSGSGYSSAKAKTKDLHFAAKMLDELGAYNIAEDIPVIIDGLSFEEIYLKDPEVIFVSLMGNEEASKQYMNSVFAQKEWQALTAVKNGRYYFLDKELYQFKPNQKWATAYEEMAKMLYPEWTEE